MYGAMETTTSTVFGDYMLITPRSWWQRNYVNVNVHELTHQWFGNCIAHFVNRDVWLTESFATYYAKIFEKKLFGEDYWQNIRNDEINMVLDAGKKNSLPVASSQSGVQRIYQKGSLVLEMLRNVMGDQGFRKAVNIYVNKYAFGYAETNDFIRCVYEATGKPYNWFFDEWILRGGEPEYVVSDSVVTDSLHHQCTLFTVRQVQQVNELHGLFRMPVRFEVHYSDDTMDNLVTTVEKPETAVLIPNSQLRQVEYLLFDPGRSILKKVTFRQPEERLKAQALKAPNMIDRYDALVQLRDMPRERKIEFLATIFDKEHFHLVKSEVLKQLSPDTSAAAQSIYRKAIHDNDALVRKSALQAMVRIPKGLQAGVEPLLYDSSFVNVEFALDALCISFPEKRDQYLDQTKDMEGWRGKNIRMKWLEISVSSGKKEFMPEIIGYCGPKYEFETRMNAFSLLKRMKYADGETIRFAEAAAKHWNSKLSGAAREYLKIAK